MREKKISPSVTRIIRHPAYPSSNTSATGMSLSRPIELTIRTNKAHISRLKDLGVKNLRDLLLFFPRTYDDRTKITPIAEIRTDVVNNIKGKISNLVEIRTKFGKKMLKAKISDESGSVDVIWFNQPFLKQFLNNGKTVYLSGKAKFGFGKISLQSPSYEEIKDDQIHVNRIVPVYHQTEGITSKWIREKIKPLIDEWSGKLEEHMPPEIISEHNLIAYRDAVKEAHFPSSEEKLRSARQRLAFDELFVLQLKALQKKWHWQHVAEHEQKSISGNEHVESFINTLPFKLTKAQIKSINEIMIDLKQPYPMTRLLQGDVGSGKTVVACAALIATLKAGYQCAVMAPTEILAKQHYSTIYKLLKPHSYNIKFLAGSTTEKQKKETYEGLQTGTVDLIIGTHAIIQEGVKFRNLGLAVIDEQHRFGVKQRDILKSNGSPHLLSLSATPIPRTLAMTIYGDQDLSVIDEMPKGRLPIITRVVPEKKRIDAYRWIENHVLKGRQAFVICPLIDESDFLEVKSAIQEFEHLSNNIFPNLKVALLHGKMKPADKANIMEAFARNEINILVSTSVIEVGIDVPNATIMLIEAADRFGLSQLHQFRGRVGRGEHQSYCFLFPKNQSQDARTRLRAMAQYTSGFKLAEIDLQIRGAGEIYGVRQSGIPDLKMASLTDSETIALARNAANTIIEKDPSLKEYPALKEKISALDEVFIGD